MGAVALRGGLPKGDRRPSLLLGVIGETLLEGDALTGVNWSGGTNGRSNYRSVWTVIIVVVNLLAADVSTRGGSALPGFRNPGPFVAVCLYGIRSKLPFESGGGVTMTD